LARMSQVAKSASAFVRAFLAILVLELEDMVVRLIRLQKLAGVRGYRWTVRLGISVDVRCPAWRLSWRARICPCRSRGPHPRSTGYRMVILNQWLAQRVLIGVRPQRRSAS